MGHQSFGIFSFHHLRTESWCLEISKQQYQGAQGGITGAQKGGSMLHPEVSLGKNIIDCKERIGEVKQNERACQKQDCLSSFCLRREAVAVSEGVNMLRSLAVSMQEKDHVNTGPNHESHEHNIWESHDNGVFCSTRHFRIF